MSQQSCAHEYLEWAKQKLDEIEATLVSLDNAAQTSKDDARTEADRVVVRIRATRDAFKANVDALRADVTAVREVADIPTHRFRRNGLKLNWPIKTLYYGITAVTGHANIIKQVIIARAEAQRESRQSSLQSVQATASDVIEQACGEIDAAIRRLTVETEKAEAELEKTSAVGGESWEAIKSSLEEVISVYDRTWKKISEAIAKGR